MLLSHIEAYQAGAFQKETFFKGGGVRRCLGLIFPTRRLQKKILTTLESLVSMWHSVKFTIWKSNFMSEDTVSDLERTETIEADVTKQVTRNQTTQVGRMRTNSHTMTKAEKEAAFSIFNPDDPESVYNMVPDELRGHLDQIPKAFLTWSEKALKDALERSGDTDPRDSRLRIQLWNRHNMIIQEGLRPKISINDLVRGICSRDYWYKKVITNPKKLALIFFPPPDYTRFLEECFHIALDNVRNVLTLPAVDKKGKVDHRLVEQQIKIWQKIEERLKGTVAKSVNINQKNLNMNVGASPSRGSMLSNNLADLEAEIRELESGPNAALDVSPPLVSEDG